MRALNRVLREPACLRRRCGMVAMVSLVSFVYVRNLRNGRGPPTKTMRHVWSVPELEMRHTWAKRTGGLLDDFQGYIRGRR